MVPPFPRAYHTSVSAVINDTIYMLSFGGFNANTYLSDLWLLTLNTTGGGLSATWTQLQPSGVLPQGRSGHGAVYLPSTYRMIIFGGENTNGYLNDVNVYDVLQNKWLSVSTSTSVNLTPRAFFSFIQYKEKQVFILGGITSAGTSGGTSGVPIWDPLVIDITQPIVTTAQVTTSLATTSLATTYQAPATTSFTTGVVNNACGSNCASNNPCVVGQCLNGECQYTNRSNGFACSNGNFCDGNSDTCQNGVCVGSGNPCDPSNFCQSYCDSANQICTNPPGNNTCNDGIFCTLNDVCQDGNCVGSGNPCSNNPYCASVCNETAKSCNLPANTPCDDGNWCDGTDYCDGNGNCVSQYSYPVTRCSNGTVCNTHCNENNQNCFNSIGTPCGNSSNQCSSEICDGSGVCSFYNLNGYQCNLGPCFVNATCYGLFKRNILHNRILNQLK